MARQRLTPPRSEMHGRPVVIKSPPAHGTSDDARRMLLGTWVTGYLEHPGVVPVYDIVKGQDDAPVVVMRRIRGKTWHSLMRDESWAEAQGARDLLEQNPRVLVRVGEVVELAIGVLCVNVALTRTPQEDLP